MAATISRDDARRYYDSFGARQDRQGFYEDAAIDVLIAQGAFPRAQSVFELGCGTGRLAERLLSDYLPASAQYVAVDLSTTMVRLAQDRLAPFGRRCQVRLSDGGWDMQPPDSRFDRFVTTYVLDLLSQEDIREVLARAHSAMVTGGLFCHAGLTKGAGPISKTTSALWALVHSIRPLLVGGCRPLVLADLIPEDRWRVIHREIVVSAAIPSEIVIAEKR